MKDIDDPKIQYPIIGYAQEPVLPLADACVPLTFIIPDIFKYVAMALESTPDNPPDGLTRDESASIHLYTMEWSDARASLYSHLNRTLKQGDRKDLQPWYKYLKLFLTALVKIPCSTAQVVWRGVRKNTTNEFPKGAQITWWAFSSTTKSLAVLESDLYLGTTGERTLFSIEVLNGRNISDHSHFHGEEEILLLPGTCMEVQSLLNPAPELHIIHLKQMVPEEPLLEPPFEGKMNIVNSLF
ncbi:unnamed protein product [Rotaria sp. Silwood1]|nr:unnamed protein product [Rotaria sp. Silwood1]CAF3573400.1 unnamed protein product [Rotaria sp. Silwood1]CAF3577353.1 unnamed protein product [Rotaria sp. Silwood1]CAF5000446.1 unnamed protein product [Rotaria sp. Silwood1]